MCETVGIFEDEMLTHSATEQSSACSGMREHFDDGSVDRRFSDLNP